MNSLVFKQGSDFVECPPSRVFKALYGINNPYGCVIYIIVVFLFFE